MRAVVIEKFGPPDVLEAREVPVPSIGPGHALIDVQVAGVTFVDTQVRSGKPPHPSMLPELPAIPGNGVGGIVVSVGSQVDEALVGTRVVATTGGAGGYAELAAAALESIIPVPDELELTDAVALLADGRTATALTDRAALSAGQTVLVEAAAGGVGTLLVQLASAAGARVIAVARGERKLELARSLGADAVLDYGDPSWLDRVARAAWDGNPERGAGERCLDVVFDGVGGAIGRAAFELLRPGGRHCAFGMASGSFAAIDPEEARNRGVELVRGAAPAAAQMTRLSARALDLAVAGDMRPVIGQTFSLERTADAHRAIESRETIGKTLLFTARSD
jgi:NADPH2:quinone reductase